jgi:hypothetical protein
LKDFPVDLYQQAYAANLQESLIVLQSYVEHANSGNSGNNNGDIMVFSNAINKLQSTLKKLKQ